MRLARLAALITTLVPALAHANGASIPDTAEFHPQSPTPGDLAMNATFGFLFSGDDGAHWGWTCHEAIIGTVSLTPRTYRNPSGAMFAAVPLGLAVQPDKSLWRTTDRGCNWLSIASLANDAVLGLAFDASGNRALAAGTDASVTTGLAWISSDGGATFGAPIVSRPGQYLTSALIAPSDPQRLYVTGLKPSPAAASVLRSMDGGSNWTEFPFSTGPDTVRLLAISPTNADLVWLRQDSTMDRVLVSTNGAATFRALLTIPADVTGFALTEGGNRAWVATRTTGGVYSASGGGPFVHLSGAPNPRCLTSHGAEVFACANPYGDDFAAGRTTDGVVWTTAMSFARIGAPISCPAGSSSADVCEPLWPGIDLKIHGAAPTPTPTPPGTGHKRGCSCSVDHGSPGMLPGLLALAALLARRSRRVATRLVEAR